MNIRELKARYYWFRLREARGAILTLGLVFSVLIAAIVFLSFVAGPGGDVFSHPWAREPETVCNTYGEGAVVCFPAPQGVKEYRQERRAVRRAQEK